MKRTCILCVLAICLCSCSSLYYGYLPGTDYQLLEPTKTIDLKGRAFNIQVRDSRKSLNRIKCSRIDLDRSTELEGDLGKQLVSQTIITMIQNSNGKIDPKAPDTVVVDLEGLSFEMIGAGYIVAHGLVQFTVSSPYLNKTYCSDMTDSDDDSPLHWYSVVTRKTGSRTMVSGSLRRATENFVSDLAAKAVTEPAGLPQNK